MSRNVWTSWCGSIRQLLPPPGYLLIAVVLVGLVEATWFLMWNMAGANNALDRVLQMRDVLIVVCLVGYGGFRVLAFHPLFRREYLGWLEKTPWTHGLPLPLGPVRLAWPDLLVVGSLVLLFEDPRVLLNPNATRISGLTGLLLFVQSHAMMATFAVWLTRPRTMAYAAAFLLAIAARLMIWSPVAGIVMLVAGTLVAHRGLSQSWSLFPWLEATEWAGRVKSGWKAAQQGSGQLLDDNTSPDRVPPTELGWPFGVCSPYVAPKVIATKEKLLVTVLAGFWFHAVLASLPQEFLPSSGMVVPFTLFMLLIGRIAMFGGQHSSPINLAGRLLTLRWIIPGYDVVVVGPICILIVAAGSGLSGYFWLGIPLDILMPIVVTLTLWTALLIGPSAESWKLTAPARIVPGRLYRNRFEELS